MNKINVRALAEGAVLAALTAIMGIFYNIPVVSFITLFWPVPIIIVGYRNGFRISIVSALIAALLVSIIVSPIVGFALFGIYAVPGAIMGYMLRKKAKASAVIGIGGVLLGITGFMEIALMLQVLLNVNLVEVFLHFGSSLDRYFDIILQSTQKAAEIYQKIGLDQTMIDQSMDQMKELMQSAKLLFPTAMLMTGITTSYINFKVVKIILHRMGYEIQGIRRFADWSLDKRSKYILGGIAVLMMGATYSKIEALSGLSLNLLLVLNLVLLVTGLSLVTYIMEQMSVKYDIPKGIQRLLLVIIALLFFRFLPYIGLFDMAADLRRLFNKTAGGAR